MRHVFTQHQDDQTFNEMMMHERRPRMDAWGEEDPALASRT
jgi:hypothetical protein